MADIKFFYGDDKGADGNPREHFEFKTGEISLKAGGAVHEHVTAGHVDESIIKEFPKEYAAFKEGRDSVESEAPLLIEEAPASTEEESEIPEGELQ